MWRVVLRSALLFAAPFLLYGLFLLARRRYPLAAEFWSRGAVSTLTIAGLIAAIGGMLALGLLAPREQGAYVPAHIENGKLAPGHFQ